MFGDDDSDSDGDDALRPASSSATTADASGLFGSDSESDDDVKPRAPPPAKRPKVTAPPPKRSKPAKAHGKKEARRGSGDEYDSGDEVVHTKDDEDFIDRDDDLADVLGEYDEDAQRFDDERPLDEHAGRSAKEEEDAFFDDTLKSLKTGRRSKMKLSPQEMENITQEMLYRMDKAHQDDLVSIAERRPALEKIKYVDHALMLMRKHQLQPMLLDFDLLSLIKKWIHPLDDGALPNVGIRTKMLNMVAEMPIYKEHLKRSGFGKVVMLLWKHPEETRENKDLCRDLIERWSRSVFNKTLDFSKLAELEAEKAENATYRRQEKRQQQQKTSTSSRSQGGDVFARGGDSGDVKPATNSSDRAAIPQQLRFDFLHRPRSKIEMNNEMAKKAPADADTRKARLAKRMQSIAKPGKKSKRACRGEMGLTRGRGEQSALAPPMNKLNEVKTCVSVLDDGYLVGPDGHEKRRAEQAGDAAERAEEELWSANQLGDDAERTPPHMTSRLASLNRELKALEVRYFRTRLQLEKSMDKNNQLRQDMTKLRGHSTKLERETCKLRNLIDRIQAEKKQLELQAINNRDYAKKIEQRFFMGTKGQSIIQCNIELGRQVKSLEKIVQDKSAAIESQRVELQDAHEKLRILKRALETRFEELQLNGSLHTGVLFELTRLQDQSTSLVAQLSGERKSAKVLQRRLADAHSKESELDEALVVREAMIGTLERERAALEDQLAALRNERQTFAFEKSTLLKFIQEQAEVKFQLDAQVKHVHEAKAAELSALHQKLQLAMEERAQVQDALRASSIQCERLQYECQSLRASNEDEQNLKFELQAREQALALQVEQLGDALSKKDDDFKAARGVCKELQSAVESYELESQEQRARIEALKGVETELLQAVAQKQSEELSLRTAMESALRDLETLSKQRNDAAKAMNEAVTISASSLDEQQALESKIEAQRKQLEQLRHSKSLLQNAMLEQLSALRKQLQLERVQRIDAEVKVKQLFAFSSPSRRNERAQADSRHGQRRFGQEEPGTTLVRQFADLGAQTSETGSLDPEAPQPLPPPTMAGAPSPLPEYFRSLTHFHPSPPSDVSSSDSDDKLEDYDHAAVQPLAKATLTLQIPPSSGSVPPLESSPEHRVGSVPPPEDHISLLELAEGDDV
ncbi:hypothetical protein PybrP1_000949 [[Pythium] brassicae (nom. inval.)]|nr:hypothetical protein PybrP1_000949 [[Pythium] brassicae (nom. inval.)]